MIVELISELSGVVGVVEYDGIPFASVGIGAGVEGAEGKGACVGAGTAGSVDGAALVDVGGVCGLVSLMPCPAVIIGVVSDGIGAATGVGPLGVNEDKTPPAGPKANGSGVATGAGAGADGMSGASEDGPSGLSGGIGVDAGAFGASASGCVGSGFGFAMGCVDAVPLGSSSSPPAAGLGRGEL